MSLKIRRGTNAERLNIIPAEGELIYTTDTKNLYVGDGLTVGGKLTNGIGYTGSSSSGYTGSAGAGYTGSAGDNGGTLASNLNISTYSITGTNLNISNNNGVTAGSLNLKNNEISSSDTTIKFGLANPLTELDFNFNTNNSSPIIIKTLKTGVGDYSIPKMSFIGHGTSTNSADCTQINPGDFIGGITFSAKQTVAQGGNSLIAGALICSIDPNGSVNNSYASGKLIFNTIGGSNFPGDIKSLTFDASGRLAVNQITATETLDVNGTAKFSGYVIFGSYTTTQRNALTAQNGMVIYNTTDGKFQGRQAGVWINLDDGTTA
jgi:hypothetical protein